MIAKDKMLNSWIKTDHLTMSNTCVWDLKAMLESGELFSRKSDGEYSMYSVNAPDYMIGHFGQYGVYRRIETEVTWQDEVNDLLSAKVDVRFPFSLEASFVNISGDISEADYIAMCHLVASMTDKPE